MIFLIVASILFLDQLVKFFALSWLELNHPVILIKNFFNLTLVYNRGAAFGMFKNQLFFFVVISVVVIPLIVYHLKNKKNSRLINIALALILAGTLGNLIDRLRFGFVVDFLDFRIWPVFNLADSAITIGALLLTWQLWGRKNVS